MILRSEDIARTYFFHLKASPLLIRSLPQSGRKVQSSQILIITNNYVKKYFFMALASKWVRHNCCDSQVSLKSSFVFLLAQFPSKECESLSIDLSWKRYALWRAVNDAFLCICSSTHRGGGTWIVLYAPDGIALMFLYLLNSSSLILATKLIMKLWS